MRLKYVPTDVYVLIIQYHTSAYIWGYRDRHDGTNIGSPLVFDDHHQDGHHDHHNEEDGREDSHNVVGVVGEECHFSGFWWKRSNLL